MKKIFKIKKNINPVKRIKNLIFLFFKKKCGNNLFINLSLLLFITLLLFGILKCILEKEIIRKITVYYGFPMKFYNILVNYTYFFVRTIL